jgi:hypothetical protein
MLVKYYNLSLDHETIRKWLRAVAITTSMRKKRPHRKKRERRNCFGELLQFDGSYHDWFEGRGAICCLLNCVDDATGSVYLKFAISENTQDVMLTMWEYINRHGIPRSLYTDRAAVYCAEEKLTDFGRAMKELGTEIIFAKSSQAKGRVGRYNRTFQDRLVKALRRESISNIADANKYLQKVSLILILVLAQTIEWITQFTFVKTKILLGVVSYPEREIFKMSASDFYKGTKKIMKGSIF